MLVEAGNGVGGGGGGDLRERMRERGGGETKRDSIE